MSSIPDDIYTSQQSHQLDKILAETYGMSASTLMARAGAAALSLIKSRWPQAKHILIFCGKGNNGGDGFELARQAQKAGLIVSVFEAGQDMSSAEALAARDAFVSTGVSIQSFSNTLPAADVIVDAIMGIGLNRAISGQYKAVIKAINEVKKSQHIPVLSLDIPSGIHADTGHVMGVAVNATVSLVFISLNSGLLTGDGATYSGKVYFDSLDIPPAAYKAFKPIARLVSLKNSAKLLSPRKRTGHKGLYGHLLVMGGDDGMMGAARIAAEAGARVGAGLISVATRKSHSVSLNQARPELMCHGVEHADDLVRLISRANVLTIGTGLGQSKWAQSLFWQAISANIPMVVDADALNLLSQYPTRRHHWVLTPHVGEAARLLNCTSLAIRKDRLAAVTALQERYGGIVVLKGAGTLIYDGHLPIRLATSGNPGMASGGMGDCLTGVIGGLLAQHFPLMEAACTGVVLHGMAGDKAAKQDGERGMLAMDLMPHLKRLVNLRDV